MLDIQTIIYFLALGSFVGVVSGLFGIGGGGIIVPVLTAMFLANNTIAENSVVHLALGTSMAIIIVTSISSIKAQQKKKAIVWDVVKMMVPGIIIGTFLATFIASKLDSFYLSIIFACFMFYSAIMMFIGKKPKPENKIFTAKTHILSGGTIGALSSLVSIGLPIAVSGTLGYIINGWSHTSMETYTLGFVSIPALICVASASYLTAPIGVMLVHKINVDLMKKLFSLIPLVLSIKMIYSLI